MSQTYIGRASWVCATVVQSTLGAPPFVGIAVPSPKLLCKDAVVKLWAQNWQLCGASVALAICAGNSFWHSAAKVRLRCRSMAPRGTGNMRAQTRQVAGEKDDLCHEGLVSHCCGKTTSAMLPQRAYAADDWCQRALVSHGCIESAHGVARLRL